MAVTAKKLTSSAREAFGVASIVKQPASSRTCDPRIVRTKAALREALISLMEERGFDGFTVNDLCQRAGLNRGTFYNHFEDKDDLLQTFENEVLRGLAVFREK